MKTVLLFMLDVIFIPIAVMFYTAKLIRHEFNSIRLSAERYFERRKNNALIKKGEMLP